ncbi:hypothetical protein CC86DRAFT_452337 [Ophiobolus disseminans]|uniref:Uncharacterized protein n=1 Tax=Ophiobolus disseminans TaxID=1469910 RepID=A0A6A7AD19_9PLEO|nr:hypothetical protein CC86DRAFT_452337 [Ophiobolus disseminans]
MHRKATFVTRHCSTHHQQALFFRLPAELRNQDYSYVLKKGPYIFKIKYLKSIDSTDERFALEPRTRNRFGLLRTCRQIHAETVLLPFALNTLHFNNVIIFKEVVDWLSNKQREVVSSITLNIQMGKDESNATLCFINSQRRNVTSITELFPNLERIIVKNRCPDEDRVQTTEVDVRVQHSKQLVKEWMSGGIEGKVNLEYQDV